MATNLDVVNHPADGYCPLDLMVPQTIDSQCGFETVRRDIIRHARKPARELVACATDVLRRPTLQTHWTFEMSAVRPVALLNFAEIENMATSRTPKSKDKLPYISIWLAAASLVATVIGIPIMFIAWIEPHLENDQKNQISIEVGNQLKDPLSKIGETNTHLSNIEESLNDLKPFIHDVVSRQFENVSKLPTQAFGERLPAVKNLLTVANDQNVKVQPEITKELTNKLLKVDVNSDGYWPTAAELLRYRSQTLNRDTEALLPSDLPNCVDRNPQHNMAVGSPDPHTVILAPALYENCRLVLDSEKDLQRINAIIESQIILKFYKCIIEYHGGAVKLTAGGNFSEKDYVFTNPIDGQQIYAGHVKRNGPALQFEDCLLLFSIHETPPPSGQYLTRSLLAQDASSAMYQPPIG